MNSGSSIWISLSHPRCLPPRLWQERVWRKGRQVIETGRSGLGREVTS